MAVAEDDLQLIPWKEAFAKRLRISRTKAYDEVRAGKIQILKIGRSSFVTVTEIRRYIADLPRGVAASK